MQALNAYSRWLMVYPYRTKMITSGLIFGLSDLVCQKFVEKSTKLDWARISQVGTVGVFAAPALHLYFLFLSDHTESVQTAHHATLVLGFKRAIAYPPLSTTRGAI